MPPDAASGSLYRNDPAALKLYAAGDIADCRHYPPEQAMARVTGSLIPVGAPVVALGDLAYPFATATTLASCYEPTWGQHRASTYPVAGNHDYVGGSTQAMREYFKLEPTVDPRFVAYARWLNLAWFVVALDSNVSGTTLDAQYQWLVETLRREFGEPGATGPGDKSRCIMVFWHAPLFSSGLHRGAGVRMKPFWELLDSYEADLVLSGHEHFYEAFEPMDSAGTRQAEGEGMREFVVGTGGAPLYGFWRPPYASRARVLRHGVLALSLLPHAYSWDFVGTDGTIFDAGAATCRYHIPSPRTPLAREAD